MNDFKRLAAVLRNFLWPQLPKLATIPSAQKQGVPQPPDCFVTSAFCAGFDSDLTIIAEIPAKEK